jgi:hypothetical protein
MGLCHMPVSRQPFGSEVVCFFYPLQHRFGSDNLLRQSSRSGLDINDDGMIGINQIVIEVSEFTPSFLHIPRSSGIGRRKISRFARMNRIAGIESLQILAHGSASSLSFSDRAHALNPPGCRAVLKSRKMFCKGVLRHSIPELVEMFVLKSRTETDARKKVSVIFVLISRTNFSRNFVRAFSASFRCLSAVNLQLNTGHRLMAKG